MSTAPADRPVGPWAREKLDALGAYLDYYTKVLKNQRRWLKGTIYIDAFAGPGRSRIRVKATSPLGGLLTELGPEDDAEEAAFIAGSPRRALEIANPFDEYVFIEMAEDRIAELERLSAEYGGQHKIDIRRGDANGQLENLLKGNISKYGYKAVVFLDPFGMQIPWETVARLAATKNTEVVINFALGMAIQRLLRRDAEIPPSWRAALDVFFGTSDWWAEVYVEVDDLLERRTIKRNDAGLRLLEFYRTRLKQAFGHVSPARLVRNTRGGHLYYLIWAGTHPKGLQGASYVLGRPESPVSKGTKPRSGEE